MNTKKAVKKISLLFPILLVSLLALSGCQQGAKTLSSVAITEYEGEQLSGADDFRENSIHGPQKIDIANYRLTISGMVAEPQTYTYDEVMENHEHYTKVVTLNCVEGWSARILWDGLLVRELLERAAPLP